jgi:hypothetical protein
MMIMIKLTLTVNGVLRMNAIQTKSGSFNEILEAIGKKEKLPPMKVSDILHVRTINILKDAFMM